MKKNKNTWTLEYKEADEWKNVGEFENVNDVFKKINESHNVKYLRYWMQDGWTMVDYGSWNSFYRFKVNGGTEE